MPQFVSSAGSLCYVGLTPQLFAYFGHLLPQQVAAIISNLNRFHYVGFYYVEPLNRLYSEGP